MSRRRRVLLLVLALVLTGGVAAAFWSAGSTPGGNGAAAAGSVQQGATPTAVAGTGGQVTVSWAATTLSTGQAVSGYRLDRYPVGGTTSQPQQGGCSGTVTALTCVETGVPSGSWQYTVTPLFATSWTGPASARSAAVAVDVTPPVNAVTLTGAGGQASKDGSTVWYGGSAAGSFRLSNAVTDAGSGPASSQTSALAGATAGWSHTPSTVSTPTGGPYVSTPFSWAAGTTGSPTQTVTGRDGAGNTVATALTFRHDGGNPLFGSIDYPNGFTTGRSVTVTFTPGVDGESGIDPSLGRIKRSAAPLVDGVCGSYVTNNVLALAPTSPYVDTTVRAGNCYTYQYVDTDRVGNKQFYGSGNVVKVDYAGAVNAESSLLSYWRFGESAITSSDTFTDTAGTLLSAHTSQDGSTWTRRTGDTGTMTVTAAGSLRGSGTSRSVYYTDEAPASADYLVEADALVRTTLLGAQAGVVGRVSPAGTGDGTYYSARYSTSQGRWELASVVNGTTSLLGSYSQSLGAGSRSRVGLDLRGSRIQLLVDGVVRVSATSTAITAAGRPGVLLRNDLVSSDSTGVHLDDLDVSPPAADSRGTNSADYHRGVGLGGPGVVAGNTAATFDGAEDHVKSVTTNAFPTGSSARSVEVWFKTPGAGPGQGRQALFSYGTNADTQEFGVWLETNGTSIKSDGGGGSDRVLTFPGNFNDNQWHHFVSTYDGTSTRMYLDGVLGSGNTVATRDTVVNATHGYAVGAILDTRTSLTGSSFFRGSLDEMSLYGTALSPATILDHYRLGTSPAPDFAAPTGGSVQAVGLGGTGARFSTSTTLSLALSPGTDPSGINAAGNQLSRATGTLNGGTCSGFGGFSQLVATDPGASVTDTVTDGACYRYQYVVSDTIGNAATYTSGDVAVDSTAPSAPSLSFSDLVNASWSGTGSALFYRAGATGSVTVTAAAADPASGIASHSFPALGTGWTSTPGSAGVTTYSWSGTPQPPGAPSVTATNNAGGTSAASPFTLTPDATAPSAGSVSYADGSSLGTTVSVGFTTGTDTGAGLGSRLLQRAAAPATGATCGSYGAFSTIAGGTDPTSSPVVDTIAAQTCYQYRYVVSDRVGNQTIATSPNVVRLASGAQWSFDAGAGTTAADASGNGNTATLQGNAGWGPGRVGGSALSLTGAPGFASTPGPVVDTGQSYSVAAWVRFNDVNGFQTAVSIDGGNVSAFFLQLSGDGRFVFDQYLGDSSGGGHTVVAGLRPVAGRWYHLVGVYDKAAGTTQLYVDGVSQGTAGGASGFTATGTTNVGRARYNGGSVDWFNGTIDDVRLVGRALTQAEVTALATP